MSCRRTLAAAVASRPTSGRRGAPASPRGHRGRRGGACDRPHWRAVEQVRGRRAPATTSRSPSSGGRGARRRAAPPPRRRPARAGGRGRRAAWRAATAAARRVRARSTVASSSGDRLRRVARRRPAPGRRPPRRGPQGRRDVERRRIRAASVGARPRRPRRGRRPPARRRPARSSSSSGPQPVVAERRAGRAGPSARARSWSPRARCRRAAGQQRLRSPGPCRAAAPRPRPGGPGGCAGRRGRCRDASSGTVHDRLEVGAGPGEHRLGLAPAAELARAASACTLSQWLREEGRSTAAGADQARAGAAGRSTMPARSKSAAW